MSEIPTKAVPIDSLTPHPENYNQHPESQIAELAESDQSFGQYRNVVVWSPDTEIDLGNGQKLYPDVSYILAGNGYWLGRRRAGRDTIEVKDYTGIPYDDALMLMQIDNAAALGAQPDPDRLKVLLEKTRERAIDRPKLGAMLARLRESAGVNGNGAEPPPDPGPQVDKAAQLAEKWGTQTGQVWQLGEHRLAVGDCTDEAVVEAVMRGERADLGLTSPPYAVGKEYEVDTSFDEHLALLRAVADRALEVIKVGGFFFVNFGEIAAQSHSKPLTGSDRQCLYLISKDYWQIFHVERGMDLYAQRIWYKPFNRLQQPFWTYHTSIPHHQEWEHIWTWRLPGGEKDECYNWDISSRAVWDTRNEATDDKPLTRHVAAFPVCLPGRAIKAHSTIDAIVWEPFSGSGTTLIACEQLKRKCRAIEIDPGYCGVAIQRWVDLTHQDPVLLSE